MDSYSSRSIERTILLGFLSVLLAGAFLLYGAVPQLDPIDSLFTATSALCVTGLSVSDVGAFPFAGQVIVALLIQIGGLGVMAMVTLGYLLTGRAVNHYRRLLLTNTLGMNSQSGVVRMFKMILTLTFVTEFIGAAFLFWGFLGRHPWPQALWSAIFHSISAFCNAGFSLYSNSLEDFIGQPIVWTTIMGLIFIGGLGFMVCLDVYQRVRGQRYRLTTHSRLVIGASLALVFLGAMSFLLAQGSGFSVGEAFFLSVTARTAGFNLTPMAALHPLSVFTLLGLMFIGASPGSTGGGVKTTTVAVVALTAHAQVRDSNSITLGKTQIGPATLSLAVAALWYYGLSLFCGTWLLALVEHAPLMSVCFDVFSALGTVGLALSPTSAYSAAGKLVLCLLMFWGRVGLLTFFWSFTRGQKGAQRVTYPEASIPIG